MSWLRACLLVVGLLAVASAPAACGGRDRMSAIDSDRLATPDHEVSSPSGRYKLAIATGQYSGDDGSGDFWRVQVRDRDDQLVLDSRERFSARFQTLVLWDDRLDRVWLSSADVGTSYWDRAANGQWKMAALGPEGIAAGEPAVPRVLVDAHPERFGPEGREKARRHLR